jgi:carbon storage regulator
MDMLVLSRQRDETIMIGDDVEITIVDIRGDKVRLGISAPPHVAVHRKEVYEAIRREKQSQSKDGKPQAVESLANRKEKNHNGQNHAAGQNASPAPSPGNEKPL